MAALRPETKPDPVLIKAIVRAHYWLGMLRNGSVKSIADIARAEGLSRTYVGSVIPFAFLAPDITAAILDGTWPIDLSLDRLMNARLPLDWAGQRSILGFKWPPEPIHRRRERQSKTALGSKPGVGRPS